MTHIENEIVIQMTWKWTLGLLISYFLEPPRTRADCQEVLNTNFPGMLNLNNSRLD